MFRMKTNPELTQMTKDLIRMFTKLEKSLTEIIKQKRIRNCCAGKYRK